MISNTCSMTKFPFTYRTIVNVCVEGKRMECWILDWRSYVSLGTKATMPNTTPMLVHDNFQKHHPYKRKQNTNNKDLHMIAQYSLAWVLILVSVCV
jgi:hypothetical protein